MSEEKLKSPKKHRVLKVVLITLGIVILIPCGFLGVTTAMCKAKGDRTKADATITNLSGLVQQKGSSLYDKDGKRLVLQGVNAGGMLVSEGWMVPYSVGEEHNSDGSIKYDSDNLPCYPKLPMEDAYAGFLSNPNLNSTQRKNIVDNFRSNWFSENDFKVVKNELKYNSIRLPFYWRDILNQNGDTFTRISEAEAFTYLDWFLTKCKENNLYCILDLHGAPGSQNGYEHSGYTKGAELWTNNTYIPDFYS